MAKAQPFVAALAAAALLAAGAQAQMIDVAQTIVPRAVPVSGTLTDGTGRPLHGQVTVTFGVYPEAEGGTSLWAETQVVTLDERGRFTAWLGATAEGLPVGVFLTGEARWLGVQASGWPEQPRVRLLSVPYALKAADAETLGGLPASAFKLARDTSAPAGGSEGAVKPAGILAASPPLAASDAVPPTAAEGTALGPNFYGTYLGYEAATAITGQYNTAVGYRGLYRTTTGNGNTGVGSGALYENTTGYSNTGLGGGALGNNKTGHNNVAVGSSALGGDTADGTFPAGYWNTAVGVSALAGIKNGYENVGVGFWALNHVFNGRSNSALGKDALFWTSDGDSNTAAGSYALYNNSVGTRNTALGYRAGINQTTGNDNIYIAHEGVAGETGKIRIGTAGTHTDTYLAGTARATAFVGDGSGLTGIAVPTPAGLTSTDTTPKSTAVGHQALLSNTNDGQYNTAAGYQALNANTDGDGNTAAGYQALLLNTSGGANTATGYMALVSNTTGNQNVAAGADALGSNTTGNGNVAAGYQALYANTTGGDNVAAGTAALYSNTTGGSNVAAGSQSLNANTTGSGNVAIGVDTLRFNTTGYSNVAVGHQALNINTTGHSNVALGPAALAFTTTGTGNTAAGIRALRSNTEGTYNVGAGLEALAANTTGANNVAAGASALRGNTTGARNVALGQRAGFNQTTGSDNIYIGHEGVSGENGTVYLGTNGTHTRTLLAGNVGIGTAAPTQKLHVAGTGSTYVTVASSGGNAGLVLTSSNTSAHLWSRSDTGAFVIENPTGTPRVTVTGDGKFGVGTQTPAQAFELLGVFSQYVNLWSTAGNAGFVLTAGPYQGIVRENVADGSLALENPNGTERLRIAANGYVGIGTAAPTHPLQLASGAHVTAGGAWTNASSRALKDRIAPLPLDAARSALLALEPVTYVYKADPADPQVGFIAEDVPALVATTDRASLSPMDLIAIAIKVIQDQQRELESLRTEVATLRATATSLDLLRERIAALERLLAERQR